jgi:hypothetical protein
MIASDGGVINALVDALPGVIAFTSGSQNSVIAGVIGGGTGVCASTLYSDAARNKSDIQYLYSAFLNILYLILAVIYLKGG